MGTPTNPAAQFVAGWVAGVTAAATVGLLSLTSLKPIKNPPTLARDAQSNGSYACRVVVMDDGTPEDTPIWTDNINNPTRLAYTKVSHSKLVSLRINSQKVELDISKPSLENLAVSILEQNPAIVNISSSPITTLDSNGKLTQTESATLPLNVAAVLIRKHINPKYPEGKIPDKNDLEKYKSSLIDVIYALHNPNESDFPHIKLRKESFQDSIDNINRLVRNGNLVINSAMNDGDKTVSVYSLIPGVVSVEAKNASYSSIGPSGSTVSSDGTIKVGDITRDPQSPSGYSVTLDGKLVTPVYFSAITPGSQAEKPFTPNSSMIAAMNGGIGRVPIQGTSFAAPKIADAASKHCNTLTETNPAERLEETRNWLLMQRDR